MNKWKDWRLTEDKIKMGFAGFDSYFKNIERNTLGFAQTPQGFTFKKIYTWRVLRFYLYY